MSTNAEMRQQLTDSKCESGRQSTGPNHYGNQSETARVPDGTRRQFLAGLGASAAVGLGMTGTGTAQESPVVAMGTTYFDPIGLSVEPGTTVRFELREGTHSATAYEDRIPLDATPFDSGIMSDGGFEYTFDVPGPYDYYCIPHQSTQVGRIVVGEPGGPAEDSSIPHGAVPDSDRILDAGTVSIDTFDDGSTNRGGMIGPMGPGMHNLGGMGWLGLLPFAVVTAVGAATAALYTRARRPGPGPNQDSAAMTKLRTQFARGDIDEAEFQRRREQLERRE
jgi:plastocyanin/uncharacterized membrane protein